MTQIIQDTNPSASEQPKDSSGSTNDKPASRNFTIRVEQEMLTSLEYVTRERKLSNVSSLVRLYISEGLQKDIERHQWSALQQMVKTLQDEGVPETLLHDALAKVVASMPHA